MATNLFNNSSFSYSHLLDSSGNERHFLGRDFMSSTHPGSRRRVKKGGFSWLIYFVFTLLGHLVDRRRVRLLLYSLLVLLTPTCLLCNFFM
jgi:hypothetical protein